jgi:catechol 2,3-dioxygenase-like lactoylglutathione lyase family enzyme
MELGAFSVSLTVKDIEASIIFYKSLGFEEFGGEGKWRILKNGTATVGLFEGMFERNMLTFNPGWDNQAQPLESFEDIRELRDRLKQAGIEYVADNTQESPGGPAHVILIDPDGNPIMLDQHV